MGYTKTINYRYFLPFLMIFIGICENFGKSSYCFHTEKETAAKAISTCKVTGGKLVEPRNENENNFVANHAKDKLISQLWIGVNDISTEDSFKYDSKDIDIVWNNWAANQPNNHDGNEDCVAIGLSMMTVSDGTSEFQVTTPGVWYDQSCTFKKAFVCEYSGKGNIFINTYTVRLRLT